MRDLQARLIAEAHHVALEDVHALVNAVLVAAREQQLQAQADAEERLAGAQVVADRLIQARLFEPRDPVDYKRPVEKRKLPPLSGQEYSRVCRLNIKDAFVTPLPFLRHMFCLVGLGNWLLLAFMGSEVGSEVKG